MVTYNTYIVVKRFAGRGICGDVVLTYGTTLNTAQNYIICSDGPVCAVTSQNAYKYFSQNDDGRGLERGKLVYDILRRLRRLKSTDSRFQHVWDRIWMDDRCRKYKRPEHADHWLWNYDFFNASIDDLTYIRNLVMRG